MIYKIDPDDFVGTSSLHTCPFHRANPGVAYAGCTCSGAFSLRKATPEEREANYRKRLPFMYSEERAGGI
jgi:hypothetical protein